MAGEVLTRHENASALSHNTFYSLEDPISEEPAHLSQIGSPRLRYVHNKGISSGHFKNKPLQISRRNTMESLPAPSEISAKAAYYNATVPSPTHTSPLRSKKSVTFTGLISKVAPQKPNSASPPSSRMQAVTWTVVKDPTSLMGLTLHAGLAGTEKCAEIVGIESKILHKIFKLLDPCTATCLGLACRKLYFFSKYAYPGKMSLWESCHAEDNNDTSTLADLLEQWVGPRYRRHVWGLDVIPKEHAYKVPQFLLRDVYGAVAGGKAEIALAKRYRDYYASELSVHQGKLFILPHPFNKGADWYEDARKVILGDGNGPYIRDSWDWNAWMSYWISFEVFSRISYMEKLRVLQRFEYQEWAESMQVSGVGLLTTPSGADKSWWALKRHLRWSSWWIGHLPAREPLPWPEPGQRRRSPCPSEKL